MNNESNKIEAGKYITCTDHPSWGLWFVRKISSNGILTINNERNNQKDIDTEEASSYWQVEDLRTYLSPAHQKLVKQAIKKERALEMAWLLENTGYDPEKHATV